jgi:hypothetical protein
MSLRTLLLLMTCAALAIVLQQTRARIAPMRAEITRLRTELGYLNVEDPGALYAIQNQTGELHRWQWKIHFPAGHKYRALCYSGYLPDRHGQIAGEWLAASQEQGDQPVKPAWLSSITTFWLHRLRTLGQGKVLSHLDLEGEVVLGAALVQRKGRWEMQLTGGDSTPIYQPNGDWLSDPTLRGGVQGDVAVRDQTTINPGEPVILIHQRRPIVKAFPGGSSSTEPQGDADSIVLWLEPVPEADVPSK